MEGFLSAVLLINAFLIHKHDFILPKDEIDHIIDQSKNKSQKGTLGKTFAYAFSALPVMIFFAPDHIPILSEIMVFLIFSLRSTHLMEVIQARSLFSNKVKGALILGSVLFSLHTLACLWQFLEPFPLGELPLLTIYNKSFYWAVTTLTTVGYGDISPTNNLSRIFTMVVMVIGIASYGVIIGSVSSLMFNMDRYKEKKKEKLDELSTFFNHYKVPINIQREVYGFYGHLLEKNNKDIDNKVMADLPKALQAELKPYMKIKLIKDIPILKNSGMKCLKEIAEKLNQQFYSPGERVVNIGDIGKEMFIIAHGSVDIEVDGKILTSLNAGQFFGEMALMEETPRTANVLANSYCDLYVFEKEDFKEITERFPALYKEFERTYLERKKALEAPAKKAA